MNRGDWAEIYTMLIAMLKGKINYGNENQDKNGDWINVEEIKVYNGGKEVIMSNKNDLIRIVKNNNEEIYLEKSYCKELVKIIYNKIVKEHSRNRNIEIKEGEKFLYKLFDKNKYKEINKRKYDIKMKLDNKKWYNINIKSNLWNPPSILNASEATKIKYQILNMKNDDVEKINAIETNQKVIDKIASIYSCSTIRYMGIQNQIFKQQLYSLDKEYEKILSIMLIYSYLYKNKEIEFISKKLAKNNKEIEEKIKKMLVELTFNIIPSISNIFNYEKIDGFLYMRFDGEILFYYKESNETKNFIYKNLKFDTPSTKKYEVCKIKYESNTNKVFFLYVQLRLKKSNNDLDNNTLKE